MTSLPEWVPLAARSLPLEEFDERQLKLFHASELKQMWKRAATALDEVDSALRVDAAAAFVGSIIHPLHFAETGTRARPTKTVKLKDRQKKADVHLRKAARQLRQAADEIRAAQKQSSYLPDSVVSFPALARLLMRVDRKLPSYFEGGETSTANVLIYLADDIENFQTPQKLFASIPGLAGQKSSWRGWLREVVVNLAEIESCYQTDFALKEVDFVQLAHVLIGPHITRDMVHDALRNQS